MFKLEAAGLAKRYGETDALLPTDLQVRTGEFLTLLGPSGSGKTTLLMMIAGLVEPTGGKLLIDGKDATYAPPGQRGIGMVFQSYALFPHMTVRENVAYGLRMRKVSAAALAKQVDEALDMVKMGAYGHRYPKELSGGQQQRVALARCFAYNPSVVLLDEPLGALDKKLREHMQFEIRRLHKELGSTFIYVTHDQEEALTMSDRICLMNHARIEQLDTPMALYDQPRTRFAAEFIGQSNLLQGEHDGAGHFRLGEARIPVPETAGEPGAAGAATLMVRPEAVELVTPGQGWLQGMIAEVVFLGSEVRAVVKLTQTDACSQTFIVRCGRERPVAPGDQVGLQWDLSRSRVLYR
ncbi:ABC transporter ATP-binding protein [Kerstersia similis]|uniref:ABC transporter ATP-binding protein n=1 Tax=Kerstersia similis TaxID=206505 RepID=UPI0039F13588